MPENYPFIFPSRCPTLKFLTNKIEIPQNIPKKHFNQQNPIRKCTAEILFSVLRTAYSSAPRRSLKAQEQRQALRLFLTYVLHQTFFPMARAASSTDKRCRISPGSAAPTPLITPFSRAFSKQAIQPLSPFTAPSAALSSFSAADASR